jgi:hypothetical protein
MVADADWADADWADADWADADWTDGGRAVVELGEMK